MPRTISVTMLPYYHPIPLRKLFPSKANPISHYNIVVFASSFWGSFVSSTLSAQMSSFRKQKHILSFPATFNFILPQSITNPVCTFAVSLILCYKSVEGLRFSRKTIVQIACWSKASFSYLIRIWANSKNNNPENHWARMCLIVMNYNP